MKAIILCAGFGTRLNQITLGKYPKALIRVNNKSILQLLIDNLKEIPQVDEAIIVSNNKYFDQFVEFKNYSEDKGFITVLNDGTNSNEERLGAIGDINFALEQLDYHGETMVLCADNWFDFKLKSLHDFYLSRGKNSVVFGKRESDEKILRAGGVAILNKYGQVVQMEEKPKGQIKGDFAVGPFYIYNPQAISKLNEYCHRYAGDHTKIDAPGNYPAFLTSPEINLPVYAYDIEGYHCIDMGTPEQYEKAQILAGQLSENIKK